MATWKAHGSNAEYWRDDNPLIQSWYRFGDDFPANNFIPVNGDTTEDYLSGLMTDSSMSRAHLFSKLAPVDSFSPTSGIAPFSVSGLKCDGPSWTNTITDCILGTLRYGPGTSTNHADKSCALGSRGFGNKGFGEHTQHSGMMVAGWTQFENVVDRPDIRRGLWGSFDNSFDGGDAQWQIFYTQEDIDTATPNHPNLRFVYKNWVFLNFGDGAKGTSSSFNNENENATVDNADTPHVIPLGEPVFWCFTVHRELNDEGSPAPAQHGIYNTNTAFGSRGSGLITMYLGTTTSGLFKVADRPISSIDINGLANNAVSSAASTPVGIGNLPQVAQFGAQRPMGRNSIFDEFVFVHDGYMSFDRIEHYMNSGILTFPENNPERPEFVPVLPGTDKLQAYFTWDNNDSMENWLANSAPATSGIFASMIRNFPNTGSDRPTPGIRGGSGLLIVSRFGSRPQDFWTPSRGNTKWHVPIGSGYNYMWPDINRARGFTWIGWMKASTRTIHFGAPHCGFFGPGNGHHTFGPMNYGGGVGEDYELRYRNQPGGWTGSISGFDDPNSLVGSNGSRGWEHSFGIRGKAIWSLYAVCIDFDNGVIYAVKDAKTVSVISLRMAPGSGFTDAQMLNNTDFNVADRGSEGAAFMFGCSSSYPDIGFPIGGTPAVFSSVDDWAFYDRILTLPEMSGYGASGIFVEPLVSPLDVSFKQTLGYWKLDGSGIYDPEGVSGIRFIDDSWYSHHLTNISGTFTQVDPLNSFAGKHATQVDTSGGMLSLERTFTGSNLDFSTVQAMPSSGFSAGMWMFVPSGDLGTQGNGVSGLPGQRIFMGNYGVQSDEHSWLLGANDNVLEARITLTNNIETTISTDQEIPFNEPFFVGFDVQPSGTTPSGELDTLVGRVWYSTEPLDNDIIQIGADVTFGTAGSVLNAASTSGFSLFNAPHRAMGFPVGTQGQAVFVYGGALTNKIWGQVKNLGINENVLGDKAVSTTDPDNISHWKMDLTGSRFIDFGKEQNFLYPINQDGNRIGVFSAIHESGVLIRQTEYYDTLPFNPSARRLDLASGIQSWTFLTWVFPPQASLSDRHYIMAKSDGLSGIQVFTPDDSLRVISQASGVLTRGENGDLAPDQWNHLAIIFDRDNNEYTTIINGRYAGCTFEPLNEVPVNNSGMALGGRGDQQLEAIAGGSAFSGLLDDTMLFSRALTLPEVSGLAKNSYSFNDGSAEFTGGPIGAWISGLPLLVVSGLIGAFMHGQAQDIELIGGYVSGVEGLCIPYGGFMHGRAFTSGQIGAFLHGSQLASGVFGHFIHGLNSVSGFFGHYQFGACQANGEFDITLNFSVVTDEDFDSRLGVEKTQFMEFDSRLGVVRITQPPICTFEAPLIGELGSGLPFVLTVSGSGIALNDKKIAATRFTFADFKGAEVGTLIDGTANSGLFEASREFDTPGWYTLKLEILDTYGYRSSCCRPFLLLPEGSTSGAFINSLPGISIESSSNTGGAINTITFTHSISGLNTTSGLLEYTDFADQQESLVNSTEMPLGTQFADFARRHDYTMPGRYCAVWTVSGEFGIVSDTIADGIDYLV